MTFQEFIENLKESFSNIGKNITKWSFRKNEKARIGLYKYFIKGLESNLSLNIKSVIEQRVLKHNRTNARKNFISRRFFAAGKAEMPFLLASLEKVNRGESNLSIFEDGWITKNEEMLIKSNEAGNIADSLKLAIDLLHKTTGIKKTVKSKLLYPFILVIVLLGMMYGFAYKFIPILVELSDVNKWTSTQYALYSLSMFLKNNSITLPLSIFSFFIFISYTLPNWKGKIRHKFDSILPFSMFREFNAALFLISLSTMMKNGSSFIISLDNMRKNSNPYMKEQIESMLSVAKKADKDNSAALNTHLLGEIGDDLEDLSRYGDFEQVLFEEGTEATEVIIEKIVKKTDTVKWIIIICVVLYVMWAFSTFMAIIQEIGKNV